jgi:long-chain acyl-CoA synthetase
VERTYSEIRPRVESIAAGLAALAVGRGDTVALVLRNSVEFLELSMAIGRAGASPVPVNWHWSSDELRYLLADSRSRVVFAHSDLLPIVLDAAPEGTTIVEVPVPEGSAADSVGRRTGSESSAAEPKSSAAEPESSAAEPKSSAAVPGSRSVLPLEKLLASESPPPAAESVPALGVVYTSGTTGKPKGIVREQVDLDEILRIAAVTMQRVGLEPGCHTLVPAPLYHTAPNTLAIIAAAIQADITIMPRFDPEAFLAAIEEHRVEQVQVVPIMFIRLLRLPEQLRKRYDLSSLRRVVHAAAPCPVPVKRRIIDWFGPIVHEYYGGSETGPVTWCDSGEWLEHPGTVGAAVDGAEIRIVGPEGIGLATGEVGTVFVKPPDYWPDFTYLGAPDKRSSMELDGFVTVGDVGRVDGDGYLYLTDRQSDMVISGGVNIYPAEIEQVLYELEGLHDCAVFGIPDDEFGEALAAHVELEKGATLSRSDVRDFVRSRLAGYKVPKVVVFTDELPREESGKLFKRRLREPYWSGTGRSI